MKKTLINGDRLNIALLYSLKRELKAKPRSTARQFWRNLNQSISLNYCSLLKGEA